MTCPHPWCPLDDHDLEDLEQLQADHDWLQDENDRLRARVADLEDIVRDLYATYALSIRLAERRRESAT